MAKEAASLVLLDDNFSTLVHAIRGGRCIYDNLRKTVLASLTTNLAELVLVLIYLPPLRAFLGFGPLGPRDWFFVLGAAFLYLWLFELVKLSKRRAVRRAGTKRPRRAR